MTNSKQKNKPLTAEADGLVPARSASGEPARRPSGSRRLSLINTEPSLTQQQFKQSVDVNNIVRHYAQTGIDPYEANKARARFVDATSKSFTEAMFHVAEVQSEFHALPATERQRYSNDPDRWLRAQEAIEPIVDPDESEALSRDDTESSPPADADKTEAENIT